MIFPIILPGFTIQDINESDQEFIIRAQSVSVSGICPSCQTISTRIHSYHHRRPQDLPISEHSVQLVLVVKRFRCQNPACSKRTFVELMPDLIPAYAHRTCRMTDALREIAFQNSGEAGAQLSCCLQMPTSPDTLLRIVMVEASCPTAKRPMP